MSVRWKICRGNPRIPILMVLLILQAVCRGEYAKLRLSNDYCNAANCIQPECYCASRQGPNHVPLTEVPQIVLMTFDDAVNEQNIGYYKKLFPTVSPRKNPNGCNIAATFFVSHEWTDYKMVRQLYLEGHEIGSHSVSHRLPKEWWSRASYAGLEEEMEGQRKNIVKEAGVPKHEIHGVRVPFLEIGGDTQFEVLTDYKFEYDASFLTGPYNDKDWRQSVWPYTLDFFPTIEYCDSTHCPQTNFTGIWEIPLNRWLGLDGKGCPMVDACKSHTLRDKADTRKYLMKNFDLHYKRNRAPFGINMHAVWFDDNDFRLTAMAEFLDEILKFGDVYIVTVHQGIAWMKNPTPLRDIKDFAPWLTCHEKRELVKRRKSTVSPSPTSAKGSLPTRASTRRKNPRHRNATEAPPNGMHKSSQEDHHGQGRNGAAPTVIGLVIFNAIIAWNTLGMISKL